MEPCAKQKPKSFNKFSKKTCASSNEVANEKTCADAKEDCREACRKQACKEGKDKISSSEKKDLLRPFFLLKMENLQKFQSESSSLKNILF